MIGLVVGGTAAPLEDIDRARYRARAVATELTDRERHVLGLIARGASNGMIVQDLYLSPRTVESHVRNIFIKLGLPPDASVDRRVLAAIAFLRSQVHEHAA